MNNKEAIETIKAAIAEVEWNYSLDYAVAFEKGIEALEKQMPERAENGKYAGRHRCGKFVFSDMKYCPECGQALDWVNGRES